MLRLSGFPVPLNYTDSSLRILLLQKLNIAPDQLLSFSVSRRSVDARKKHDVHFVISVDLTLKEEASILRRCTCLTPVQFPPPEVLPASRMISRPLVVGSGPAGLFAALMLARAGARPLLIERGKPVEQRTQDVLSFEETGILHPESNIQFGEGGAGAFSDGKLTCGIKSPYIRIVLQTFVDHGAPEEILVDQKPHIGTDLLRGVVSSIRREILRLGGEVRFETRMEELLLRNAQVEGAVLATGNSREEFLTRTVLLCIGHSARDTMRRLLEQQVLMVQKPFAVGVRIEHPREWVDRTQYGSFAGHPALGAASYKLVSHTRDQRGVYTFCMCPGGRVIAAASDPGGIVTNGMSLHSRSDRNSNSALLVGVRPEDFGNSHPLAGFIFQQAMEQKAFILAGRSYAAPAQRVEDFLARRPTRAFSSVLPSYRPGVIPSELDGIFPSFVTENLRHGILSMDHQMRGFAMPDAVLTGPETRSSSPVRLPRNAAGESESIRGLFPAGEGAGFAGGIVSAAIDGISAARHALEQSIGI